nr:MAG TPA: hypothetical protein [Caudoviricetes sp.]
MRDSNPRKRSQRPGFHTGKTRINAKNFGAGK